MNTIQVQEFVQSDRFPKRKKGQTFHQTKPNEKEGKIERNKKHERTEGNGRAGSRKKTNCP